MKTLLLSSLLAAAAASVSLAGPPASRPSGAYVPFDPDAAIAPHWLSREPITLRLTFTPGVPAPAAPELREVLERLTWQPDPSRDTMVRWQISGYVPVGDHATLVCTPMVSGDPSEFLPQLGEAGGPREGAAGGARLAAALRGVFEDVSAGASATRPSDDAADVRARFAGVEGQLGETRRMRQALRAMIDLRQPDPGGVLLVKVNALNTERMKLEMQRTAKEARRTALSMAIAKQHTAADEEAREAEKQVTLHLQTILTLREQEAARLEQMVKAGTADRRELDEAKAKVAEARANMAERQMAAVRGAKGELLQRLTDEMALLNVDLTDTEIQLDLITNELQELSPNHATTQSLQRVLAEGLVEPGQASAPPPLYGELGRQEARLLRQKLALQIRSVAVE